MTNAPTQTSRDWLGSVHTSLLAWWMPKAAIMRYHYGISLCRTGGREPHARLFQAIRQWLRG